MRFGIHMPLKGGFERNILRLKELGCETVQIFPGNPTGWKMGAADPDELAQRAAFLEQHAIHPLVIHSAYLINLAGPSVEFHAKSVRLLNETMEKAALYRSPFVVLHAGNHGGDGAGQGLERVIKTIDSALPGWPESVKLVLENTAGSGTAVGSRFEELAVILQAFPAGKLGVCLDTAHAWAAGYDLGLARGVEETLDHFEKHIGLANLDVIHVNDAKVNMGSRVDRHEHIGSGAIGLEGFRALLRRDWPAGLPVILETPEIGSDWDRVNMDTLRGILE